jgi:hypothetical protein
MSASKLFVLVALVALAAPAAIAEEVVVASPATLTCTGCEVIRTSPHRVVVVQTLTEPIPSDNVTLPFVGAAPFAAGKALPRPFVGERPAISVAARPYFGERPAPQPPVDGTSVQIPAEPEKR